MNPHFKHPPAVLTVVSAGLISFFLSMEEECLSKISIQGGPTSVHCDPNDKKLQKGSEDFKIASLKFESTHALQHT